jgi:hypothetical protein
MKTRTFKKLFFVISLLVICISFTKCEKAVQCDTTHDNKVGAMCNDGTKSNSTGSGTCSNHGGVKYWLCTD